ncbi:MAG TPA: nucleoside triphosphate pyrophosphohydrolase [Candidatus Atribacteria bacterium]|nr:nucleoside triphosphate pyrophosphohydrolase [Candidatus Atribacteria bacterium]HQE25016.1 nucleoside triphosphate pyrophosphohydrolase [Candidatus Atribacteria bacterium]
MSNGRAGELFEELLEVVATLRGEKGCPWDKEQTRETLKPLMVEELYEALDAIDQKDEVRLKEELGDMLLHIVFHAQIGKENHTFTIEEVLEYLIYKMKRRHPHVFGEAKVKDVDTVLLNWEKIKEEERREAGMLSTLPRGLPALLRAQAVGERASRVGFDWRAPEEVEKKVEEEWGEFKEAWKSKDPQKMEEEWGDLVFALVNLARHLNIQAEEALQGANNRFTERFGFIEKEIKEQGRELCSVTLEEMDVLWEKAKEKLAPEKR